jgi:hypothetical protein
MRSFTEAVPGTFSQPEELLKMDQSELITGSDVMLPQSQNEVPDDFSVFESKDLEFVCVGEETAEGLVRASCVDSYHDLTNPAYIQSAVLPKSEESSSTEWSLKLENHKRFATTDSIDSLTALAQVDSLGQVEYKIKPIDNICQKSVQSAEWHVKSGSGFLDIQLAFHNVPDQYSSSEQLFVRCVIFRQHSEFRHLPVDTICPKHLKPGTRHPMHVLQALPGPDQDHFYTSTEYRKSISFPCSGRDSSGNIHAGLQLQFICNASCNTCSDPAFRNKEKAQDLLLVITLEVLDDSKNAITLARTSVPVWPKAAVSARDLTKGARRLAKGGLAQKKNKAISKETEALAKDVINRAQLEKIPIDILLKCIKNLCKEN